MLLAWHVLFVRCESVYPGSQLKVAIDIYVVPLEYDIKPWSSGEIVPQSVKRRMLILGLENLFKV